MMVTSEFFHSTIEQVSTNETNQALPWYQKEYKRTNLNCQLCLEAAIPYSYLASLSKKLDAR